MILIEFGKSVNQVDVCAQNRLGALLSSRFHPLHLSQQFKDDPILKQEVFYQGIVFSNIMRCLPGKLYGNILINAFVAVTKDQICTLFYIRLRE